MNSLDERYGYDANFTSDVLDYLKCNVCHLVMRQPVQIMTCGHRFCKPCFERLQGYSTHLSTQLCCPIDRDPIDINKVFDDTAVSRDIGNLQVTCSYVEFGCSWKGDLRNLMDHEKECQHLKNQNVQNQNQVANSENTRLVAELLKQVQSCENTMNEKEKDLAHMKYDIHEMKKKYGERENEVAALKTSNEEILREMSETKKINEKLEEYFKGEIETLEKRNSKLETRLKSLETQTKEDTKIIPEQLKSLEMQIKANETTVMECKDLSVSKIQLETFKKDMTNKIKLLETQIKTNEAAIKENKDKAASKRQLENFKTNITNKLKEKENMKQPTPASVHPQALTNINDQLSTFQTRLGSLEKLHTNFREDTVHHLENIENITFCHEPYCKEKNIKIKWVMTNFQKNYDARKNIYSPMFYTSLQGYCFKLCVDWSGHKKQFLRLYLCICRNEHTPVEQDAKHVLEPFRIEYDLEIHHKDGGSKVHSITFSKLDLYRESCFTIRPNVNEVRHGLGLFSILHKSTWSDYIINDMMYITCTFRI